MSHDVKDIDNIKAIKSRLEDLQSKRMEIGIIADDEDSELLMYATVNEYGISIKVTDKMRNYLHYQDIHLKKSTEEIVIPERSFIRNGYESIKDDLTLLMTQGVTAVVKGNMTADEFYGRVGSWASGKITSYLISLSEPPNSEWTVKKKGSSNPLVGSTGRLAQSISWKVVNK